MPMQVSRARCSDSQPPGAGCLGVVGVAIQRHAHRVAAAAGHPGSDPEYELAGAARQHDPFSLHAMKGCQLCPQRRIRWVRVAAGIAALHGSQRLRARAAGIAVGGEVMQRHAQRVRPAMPMRWVCKCRHQDH